MGPLLGHHRSNLGLHLGDVRAEQAQLPVGARQLCLPRAGRISMLLLKSLREQCIHPARRAHLELGHPLPQRLSVEKNKRFIKIQRLSRTHNNAWRPRPTT